MRVCGSAAVCRSQLLAAARVLAARRTRSYCGAAPLGDPSAAAAAAALPQQPVLAPAVASLSPEAVAPGAAGEFAGDAAA